MRKPERNAAQLDGVALYHHTRTSSATITRSGGGQKRFERRASGLPLSMVIISPCCPISFDSVRLADCAASPGTARREWRWRQVYVPIGVTHRQSILRMHGGRGRVDALRDVVGCKAAIRRRLHRARRPRTVTRRAGAGCQRRIVICLAPLAPRRRVLTTRRRASRASMLSGSVYLGALNHRLTHLPERACHTASTQREDGESWASGLSGAALV